MKIEISVPEVIDLCKEIQKQPERVFDMIRSEVKQNVGQYLSEMMKVELTHFLNRKPFERIDGDVNHRNGSYPRRFTLKGIGEVATRVPRDRKGQFKTQVLPRSKRYEKRLREELCMLFLTGVSTRTLSLISKKLMGRQISASEVSKVNQELIDAVEKWRVRDLSGEVIKYLFLDGVCFHMRIGGSVEVVMVLVAIGVTDKGRKLVLGLQAGDKESASNWREFFKDLKKRGMDNRHVRLGIMDGLTGLEKVFKEEFPKAKVQRCQVHLVRNVLAKVPKKLKKTVADDIRSIFYAPSKKKAKEFFNHFKSKWEKDLPSAVKCLEHSLDASLTFFMCPEEEWISLRTTNVIERLNKEFKRRTKPMEILAGENACYTLLAFVCIKMEIHWKSNPIGKVRQNLPFYKQIAQHEITQNC
jgi:putative transposase